MRGRLHVRWRRGLQRAFRAIRRLCGPVWRRFRPAVFTWSDESLLAVRQGLDTEGIDTRLRVPDPPYAAPWLTGLIAARLAMLHATCLERSLIMQRWMMAIGRPHDVLIGVKSPRETTIAHAWLDHEDSQGHHVLLRLPPIRAPHSR
jgi:hypothetical protein